MNRRCKYYTSQLQQGKGLFKSVSKQDIVSDSYCGIVGESSMSEAFPLTDIPDMREALFEIFNFLSKLHVYSAL
jgi:hypothetical protein